MVDRGLLVAALHPFYAAEVVQGLSFIVPVDDLTGEGEGLLKTIGCRPVTASPYQRKAEIVQRGDLPELVADLAEDRQRPPQVDGRLPIPTLPPIDNAEVAKRPGLARVVADLAEDCQRLPELADRLLVPTLPGVEGAKAPQCVSLRRAVAGLPGGVQSVSVHDTAFGVVPADLEVAEQDRSQMGGMTRPALRGRVPGDGDQDGPFGVQPGARRDGAGYRRRRGGRLGDVRPTVALSWDEGVHRSGCGVQVVVEQEGQRRPPLVPGVLGGAELTGVGA